MSGQEIAALIVAVTGALAAVFAGVRNLRSDKTKGEVAASVGLLTGYAGILAELRIEVERLKAGHAEDRKAWLVERADAREEYRDDIERLKAEHRTELVTAYERIDQLGQEVYLLQHRPPETRDRRGDL